MFKGGFSKKIGMLLAIILMLTSIDVMAIESGNDKLGVSIDNVESVSAGDLLQEEKVFEEDGLRYTCNVVSQWTDAYNVNIKIDNLTETNIDNWCIKFPLSQEIIKIWNAEVVDYNDGIYVIKNTEWNQDIKSGESVVFGCIIRGSYVECPQYYLLASERSKTEKEKYEVFYNTTDVWAGGFNGIITIYNRTDKTIEDWQLEFDFENEISNIWNGSIIKHEGIHYIVNCMEYNQNIYPKSSIEIGFTVNNGNANKLVFNEVLEEVRLGDDKNADKNQDIDSGEGLDKEESNIELFINDENFVYNENIDMYVVNEKLEMISGTVTEEETVQFLSFVITDVNGVVVDEGSINVEEKWSINAPGLVIGCNYVMVSAIGKNGEIYSQEVKILNVSKNNIENTYVDMEDTDSDGVCNYYESVIGTNSEVYDTDKDGLSDLIEFTIMGTDPCNHDSDNNGIEDGDEDIDSDGLSNYEEVTHKASMFSIDTDYDGLNDYDEVKYYNTNPMNSDTDSDGMMDQREIELGLNPLEIDSNGNGIEDGEELINQTYFLELVNEEKKAIKSVSINFDCSGDINNNLFVTDVYNLDMRSRDVIGLVSVPVNISCYQEFDTANIAFEYNEKMLNTEEENLCILWYDIQNDNYILAENTVIDIEKNIISTTTTHFSTWLVVDKEQWMKCWETPVSVMEGTSAGGYSSLNVELEDGIHRYQLFEYYGSWSDAEEICNHAGGYLATIQSEYENTVVYNYIIQQGCVSAYIGLSDEDMEGQWKWSNGEGLDYTKWHSGEPNGRNLENYAMYYYLYKDGSWNDGSFNSGHTVKDVSIFICEWEDIDIDTDSDSDGLADYYEQNGFKLSNGTILFTDPFKADSDEDGIGDYNEVGGLPIIEEYIIDGKVYKVLVNHTDSYGELPDMFVYVDGRTNKNGEVYVGGIEYIPFLQNYYESKYVNKEYFNLFGEGRMLIPTQVHNLSNERWLYMSSEEQDALISKYAILDAILYTAMLISPDSQDIFDLYVSGSGAEGVGLGEEITRHYFDCDYMFWGKDRIGSNAAYISLMENMPKVIIAASSVLSKENNEIYISINPTQSWEGFTYVDFFDNEWYDWVTEAIGIMLPNLSGFGIFNSALPAVTAHCTYDYKTEEYSVEYIYYIIDYYDFPGLPFLAEQDALGLAESFELYGKCYGEYTWSKGEWASEFEFNY